MEMNYLEQHQNFKEVLERELDRMITDEDATVTIRNIPSLVFCEATGCKPYDFNGWECDWWGDFEYKGYLFKVSGTAWDGRISVYEIE